MFWSYEAKYTIEEKYAHISIRMEMLLQSVS